MKKSALLLAGVMTASIAIVPLAACSAPKGSKFDVENYAKPISEHSNTIDEGLSFTGASTLNFEVAQFSGGVAFAHRFLIAHGTGANDGKVQLFDTLTDTAAISTWYTAIRLVTTGMGFPWNLNGEYLAVRLEAEDGKVQFCGPDGKLLTNDTVAEASVEFGMETTDDGIVYTFTYQKADAEGNPTGDEITKYFTYLEDEEGERVWKAESASILDPAANDEYAIGNMVAVSKKPLSDILYVDEEDYPDYPYFDYSFSYEGTGDPFDRYKEEMISGTFTSWQGSEEKGSVTIENGKVLGIAGDNVIFYELAPVSADATKGYNLEISTGISVTKLQYTLYSCNFVKGGKVKEVKTDYVIMNRAGNIFYNNDADLFDMWVVYGAYKKTNGVAIVSTIMGEGSYSKEYDLILDSKGHVSADITTKDIGYSFYKLADDRYLTGSIIVDGKLNTVAQFESTPKIWESAELLQVEVGDTYAFIDYSGKVVISPIEFVSAKYYDNMLIAKVQADDTYEYIAYSAARPSGTPVDEIIPFNEEEDTVISLSTTHGWNLIAKRTQKDGEETYSYSIYSHSGSQIGSTVTGITDSNGMFAVGKKAYVVFEKGDDIVTIVLK